MQINNWKRLIGPLLTALHYSTSGNYRLTEEDVETELKSLGLDSVALLGFLTAVEDELGMEWTADVPTTSFFSIKTIAEYIDGSGQIGFAK